eukprot:359937-Chlamydomonas_euryale.AAC.3
MQAMATMQAAATMQAEPAVQAVATMRPLFPRRDSNREGGPAHWRRGYVLLLLQTHRRVCQCLTETTATAPQRRRAAVMHQAVNDCLVCFCACVKAAYCSMAHISKPLLVIHCAWMADSIFSDTLCMDGRLNLALRGLVSAVAWLTELAVLQQLLRMTLFLHNALRPSPSLALRA